jgi:hypothetical protein
MNKKGLTVRGFLLLFKIGMIVIFQMGEGNVARQSGVGLPLLGGGG